MANIHFFLREGKNNKSSINVLITVSRGHQIKRSTKLTILNSNWDKKKYCPKKNIDNTVINQKLDKIEQDIIKALGTVEPNDITTHWLDDIIKSGLPEKRLKFDYLIEYANHYADSRATVTVKGQKLSKSTPQKYQNIAKKLQEFENHQKRKFLIRDVNLKFVQEFGNYLQKHQNIKSNTIGRYIKFVKTIVLAAKKEDIEVHKEAEYIKGWTEKIIIHILNIEELSKIYQATMPTKTLEHVRDWLIIGCFTGQRVSDLLRMNKKMIYNGEEIDYIELEQKKTKAKVIIPIAEQIQEVLDKYNGDFPPSLGNTNDAKAVLFNRNIKKVCQVAEINTETTDYIFDSETKRKVQKTLSKYHFVTSHICRRSFASNFYGLRNFSTPMIMNITGHTTENAFLKYIGKTGLDLSREFARSLKNSNISLKKEKD